MSKSLEEYGDRKSCAVTTAKRLAQFLGDERIKDKGLACNYVVATCAPPFARATLALLCLCRRSWLMGDMYALQQLVQGEALDRRGRD